MQERAESEHVASNSGADAFEVDWDLTELLNSGSPAILTGCQHQKQVIKQDRLFLVFNADGGVYEGCGCGMGLFREDTRFLSHLGFRIEGLAPTLLNCTTDQTNIGHLEFVNPPLKLRDGSEVKQETIHISMTRAISQEYRERIRLTNFNTFDVTLQLSLDFRADFADLFEVRGLHRQGRGTFFLPKSNSHTLALGYCGGDKLLRQAHVMFDRPPEHTQPIRCEHPAIGAAVDWTLTIPGRGGQVSFEYRIQLLEGEEKPAPQIAFETLLARASGQNRKENLFSARLNTSNEVFNLAVDWCLRDLVALTNQYPTGPFIAAGIPWFTCPFGRDALITGLQTLWMGPALAKGVLRYLAHNQGRVVNDFRDEEPGKILHEVRFGELARLNLVPHTPYYGTIDATPLWLILLSETFRWTGDVALVHELWEHVEAALLWLDTYGDLDDDGFFEYQCKSPKGIRNQGWKDSFNAIIFPDGTLAQSPIALAEVQGYVYDAKRRIAELCLIIGQDKLAKRLTGEALVLKDSFNQRFWIEAEGYFAMALSHDKQQVPTTASNPGHCLWSNIVASSRLEAVVSRLMQPDMFSGWGIRTLSAASPVYNPIGYHIGSVWPHDTAIIAKGMADRGYKQEANRLFTALFETSQHFAYYRLPELFCGFAREEEYTRPSPYPVACSPQAWAAGTPLLLLQAALGLQADAARNTLKIQQPMLPHWLNELSITGLQVGAAEVDLDFIQIHGVTTTRIRRKQGTVQILIEG